MGGLARTRRRPVQEIIGQVLKPLSSFGKRKAAALAFAGGLAITGVYEHGKISETNRVFNGEFRQVALLSQQWDEDKFQAYINSIGPDYQLQTNAIINASANFIKTGIYNYDDQYKALLIKDMAKLMWLKLSLENEYNLNPKSNQKPHLSLSQKKELGEVYSGIVWRQDLLKLAENKGKLSPQQINDLQKQINEDKNKFDYWKNLKIDPFAEIMSSF